MHPRNRHAAGYDFAALTARVPELARFVRPGPSGRPTIDFADASAVLELNRALLKVDYGVESWDLPAGALCPPVPGRADYVHAAADLLASSRGGNIPRASGVRVLDIGVGASVIYPILGRAEYGWSFVGTDIDDAALENARRLVAANPALAGAVELRRQTAPAILRGVMKAGEFFDLTLCNPPFHASAQEAQAQAARKWTGLKRPQSGRNFGGRGAELWTPGGEAAFVRRLIEESAELRERAGWFTTLIARSAHVSAAEKALERAGAADARVVEMAQGVKKSRFIAWTFAR